MLTGEAISWLGNADWQAFSTSAQLSALGLGATATLVGDGRTISRLITRGPVLSGNKSRYMRTIGAFALTLLWLSTVAQVLLDRSPEKHAFTVAVCMALSVNAIFASHVMLPALAVARRPAAVHLAHRLILATSLISTASLVGWLFLAAVVFLDVVARVPTLLLLFALSAQWLLLGMVVWGLAITVRLSAPDPRGRSQRPRVEPLERAFDPTGVVVTGPGGQPTRKPADWGDDRRHDAVADAGPATSRPVETQASDPPSLDADAIRSATRGAFLGAAGISFFVNILMLTGPLFMLQVYDRVLTSKSVPTLMALLMLTALLFVFMGILDFLRARVLVRIGLRIDRLASAQIFEKTIAVTDAETGKQNARLLRDLQNVRQYVSGAGVAALFDMPWMPLYLAIVFLFHWALGVIALVGTVILFALSLLSERLSAKPAMQAAEHAAEAERLAQSGARSSELLQALGMSDVFRSRWVRLHSAEVLVQTKAADVSGLLTVLSKTSRLMLQSAMLAGGAYFALRGEISPGVMIAASILMSRALAPVEQAMAHWRHLVAARQGIAHLTEALHQSGAATTRLALPDPSGRVSVQGLFAGPVGQREPILKGLNFSLEPGDALGVLGPSGSGKSTLARILVGVWPCLRGAVRLDGSPLDHWPPEQLGRHIGYLPQNAELFEGTVAENIARFRSDVSPDAIIAAAEMANVHDMIVTLPDGYNTRVSDVNTELSGGQRQRIALARALFGDPAFVVLDEPNSNLDSQGDTALAQAISKLRVSGRTVVVMTHRRQALEPVNLMLVLGEGRQVQFGAKDEVLRAAAMSARQKGRVLRVAK